VTVLDATMSESPSIVLTQTRKRKVSQVGGIPGPVLAQNRVARVISNPETRTQATPKCLKRSYAFYDPSSASASRRSNVTHGKLIYS